MQTFEKLNLLNQEGFYIQKDEYEEKSMPGTLKITIT